MVQIYYLGLILRMALKFCTGVAKRLKLKVRRLLALIPTFIQKLLWKNWLRGDLFVPPPSWKGLTHFMSLVSLCTWKHQKASSFLIFSGGIERDQSYEVGWGVFKVCVDISQKKLQGIHGFWSYLFLLKFELNTFL